MAIPIALLPLGIYVLLVAAGLFLGRFYGELPCLTLPIVSNQNSSRDALKAEALPRQFYHENKVGSIMSWFTMI